MKASLVKKILFGLLAVGGLIYLGLRVEASRPSDKFATPGFKGPDFSFQDRNGKFVSASDLKGKVWVVDFIFSRCAGSCPMLTHQLKTLQDIWSGNGDLKLVTFTVDPEHDTVEVLKKYAEEFKADPNQWFFLTGVKKDLYKVYSEGFKITAQDDPEGGEGFQFIHSTRVLLMDGNGMIRGLYDGQDDEEMAKLQRDVRYLMSSRNHL